MLHNEDINQFNFNKFLIKLFEFLIKLKLVEMIHREKYQSLLQYILDFK